MQTTASTMVRCECCCRRWIILLVISLAVRVSKGTHEQVPYVENCDVSSVIGGQPITIQELCGEHFAIMVPGISYDRERFPSDSFPWMLELTLVTDNQDPDNVIKSSKVVTILEAELMGDNVTHILLEQLDGDPLFDVPAGKCDNRDGTGTMRLYSNNYSNDSMITSGLFRVLCDFSAVDLVLEKSPDLASIGMLEAHIDGNTNLSSALGSTDFTNYQVTLNGHVQMLEPEDTCIYAIAYLTKTPYTDGMDDMISAGQCYNIPHITYRDTLVGTPICYRYDSGPVDVLELVRSSDTPIRACGTHVLVLQVDPMDTLHNEGNKCNNYVMFDVYFHCDQFMMGHMGQNGASSHCELHMGAFGSDRYQLFDTRFTHHSMWYDDMMSEYYNHVVMYRQDGESWMETHDDTMGIQTEGFGLLKVFNTYWESMNMSDMCDDLGSDMGIHSAISGLEGLDETFDEDSQTAWVPEYIEARNTLDQMTNSSYMDYEFTAQTMINKHDTLVQPGDDRPYFELMQFRMAKSAYNATAMIARKMASGMTRNSTKMVAADDACMVSGSMEYLSHALSMLDPEMGYNQNYGMMEVADIVGNLTRIALSMRHFYPHFVCLERTLRRLMGYLERWENATYDERQMMDMDWLFDSDQVGDANRAGDNRIQYSGCGAKLNHCLKKFQTICHAMEPMKPVASLEEVRVDVCRVRLLKQKAKEQYRILGLQKLKENMMNGDMRDYCRNDPIAPQTGPLTLWKMVDELFGQGHTQVVYRGTPTLDNHGVMWRKVAVCSCDMCNHNNHTNMYQGP